MTNNNFISKKVVYLLQTFISISLLSFLFYQTPYEKIVKQLENIELSWFFFSMVLLQIVLLLQSIRWRILTIMPEQDKPRIISYLYHVLMGNFFNLLLPSSLGGDAVKSYALGKKIHNISKAVSALLFSRILGVVALLFLFWMTFLAIANIPRYSALFFMAVLSCGILLFFYLLLFSKYNFHRSVLSGQSLIMTLADFIKEVLIYRSNRNLVAKGLLISIGIQIIVISCEYCMYRAAGVTLPYSSVFIFVPIIHLITILPISLYGFGVREWISIQLFTTLPSISSEHCLAAIFIGYILALIQASMGGTLIVAKSLSKRKSDNK